jgi:UDP-2,3-diacylglucosamine pyrophosphatase LpxH
VQAFENAAAQAARSRNLDGIICGHIHRAEVREIDGVTYCNDGDWVESCTALVESASGELSLWQAGVSTGHGQSEELVEIAA